MTARDCRHKQLPLLKMFRAPIRCSFALLVVLRRIVKRSWSVVLRRWSCNRMISLRTSVKAASPAQPMLVSSGVGVVVNPDCCIALHRQSPVSVTSCWCRCRSRIAAGHRGGIATGGCLEDFLVFCGVACKSNDLCRPLRGYRRRSVSLADLRDGSWRDGQSWHAEVVEVCAGCRRQKPLLRLGHPAVHQKQLHCTKILKMHHGLHTTPAPPEHDGVVQDLQE